jgi:type I restriction enzyme M protein
MNADIKRHIDTARQILVGVVPNPTSQIDQITNALIYKFMDDMDSAAIKQGDEPSFFINDLEPYAWTRIMDSRIGNQERMNLYGEALTKFSQSKQLPPLFREVFKSAFLPYRSPETLGLFLKEISYFDYTHPEDLGDAYEYLLSIMSSQGDAGQFRTPRHIIDFIVDIINPTKNDKILDPACGTGGFLVSAYKHILDQTTNKTENTETKTLTPDERKKLMHNLEGYDVDPTMVRIAQVNMYLHQFKNPQIHQYNSLSEEEKWNEKFDIILANPPFMSPKGGVKTHKKFTIDSSRSEVLFVDYIINHLRPKGKAGIIVPEGIIFQSGKAHKELRKNLINNGLYAVVSLPPGVFNPYSGVKTSILLIDNEISKQTDEILFIKIENDGYDLGAQRRPIHKNDLPIALEILDQWKSGQKLEHKIAQYVATNQIAQGEDYNLSGDRYRITTDYSNAKWPMVELGEVAEIRMGETLIKSDLTGEARPIFSADTSDDPWAFSDKTKLSFGKKTIVVGARGTIGSIKLPQLDDFTCTQTTIAVTVSEEVNEKYIYYLLKNYDFSSIREGVGIPMITVKAVSKIKIPLPPLEIQEQIVAELDSYSAIINGTTQITQNWKPKIDINPEWEKVKLGEVCDIKRGISYSSADLNEDKGIPMFNLKSIKRDEQNQAPDFKYYAGKYKDDNYCTIGDILIAVTDLTKNLLIGSPRLIVEEGSFLYSMDLIKLILSEKINNLFLYYYLRSKSYRDYIVTFSNGANVKHLKVTGLLDFEIPLPPLKIQKQIVEEIEVERALVESSKKLIEIYEQKTKATIAKLWEE